MIFTVRDWNIMRQTIREVRVIAFVTEHVLLIPELPLKTKQEIYRRY